MAKEIHLETEINASIEDCWKAITNSKYIREYMFGSEVESEWKVGQPITYFMVNEGQRVDMVYGNVEEIDPPYRLKHTLIPAQATYEHDADNHIYCEYILENKDGKTNLKINQGGFEGAVEGENRYESAKRGWEAVLPKLKEVAENIEK